MTFAPTVFEPSEPLIAEYRRRYQQGTEDEWSSAARRYLADARAGVLRYEGVVPVSRQAMQGRPVSERLPERLAGFARAEYDYWFRGGRDDNQVPDPAVTLLYSRLLNPMRARAVNRALAGEYIAARDLPLLDYVFFPMHTEPEMSLVGAEPLLPESDRRRQEHRAVAAGRVPGPDQGAPGVDGQASAQLLPQAPRRAQPADCGSGPELARDRRALPAW